MSALLIITTELESNNHGKFKMLDANRIGNNIVCPNCGHTFTIVNHVVPAPKGSGGCKAFATCPICNYESCANRDSYNNEPNSSNLDMSKP